jgi:hypothetical protein
MSAWSQEVQSSAQELPHACALLRACGLPGETKARVEQGHRLFFLVFFNDSQKIT